MGIVSNGSFWIYDVEELRSQDPTFPTHEGWGEFQGHIGLGNYTRFTVPDGVYSISVVMVAGGGAGNLRYETTDPNRVGGGGGQLVYMNDYPVTPGDTILFHNAVPRDPATGSTINQLTYYGGAGVLPVMLAPNSAFDGSANNAILAAFPGISGQYINDGNQANAWGPYSGSGGGYEANGAKANLQAIFRIPQIAIDNADGGGRGGNGNFGGAGGAGGYTNSGGDAPSTASYASGLSLGGGGSAGLNDLDYATPFAGGTYLYGKGPVSQVGTRPYRQYRTLHTTPRRFGLQFVNGYGEAPPANYTPASVNEGLTVLGFNITKQDPDMAGSRPSYSVPWPQYNTFYPGVTNNELELFNVVHEYGLYGAGQVFRSFFTIHPHGLFVSSGQIAASASTAYGVSGWARSAHFRIVWPGNVRKFPSQNVQYVPNPGSTWNWESDTPNNRRTDRDGFNFSDYTANGYIGTYPAI